MQFCSTCGASLKTQVQGPLSPQMPVAGPAPQQEKAYWKGEGELIVKKTMAKGAGAKAASWLALGPVGYVAFGRDKKSKSKAEGTMVVTERAIYCAGNEYEFDKILSVTQEGGFSKSIVLTFERGEGGGNQGGLLGGGMTVEVEIKAKDADGLFKGLEQARMSNVRF